MSLPQPSRSSSETAAMSKPKPAVKGLSLDDFRAANADTSGHTCTLRDLLATLPPADAATVHAAIEDASIQATAIHRVLKARYGWARGEQVITRHRRGKCATCLR
jgi:hypothetical protein